MEINVQQNVSLAQFNTFRIGGSVRFFARAHNWQTIVALKSFAKQQRVPYMMLGGGSNVLFADDGYPGLVILNQMERIKFSDNKVTVESGVTWSRLVLLAAGKNLGGMSGMISVPGTIGGAVYGNAGVPDVCMSDLMISAVILHANSNKPVVVGPDYAGFAYRTSRFKQTKDIILSVTLQLIPVPKGLIKNEINKYIKDRCLKQPAGLTCGSFFKNPGTFPSAGWLIDQSGCKGMKLGGAQISEKHANFIMNTGKATASDVINLALKVHGIVKEKYDIELEPEVQILPVNPFSKKTGIRKPETSN